MMFPTMHKVYRKIRKPKKESSAKDRFNPFAPPRAFDKIKKLTLLTGRRIPMLLLPMVRLLYSHNTCSILVLP